MGSAPPVADSWVPDVIVPLSGCEAEEVGGLLVALAGILREGGLSDSQISAGFPCSELTAAQTADAAARLAGHLAEQVASRLGAPTE